MKIGIIIYHSNLKNYISDNILNDCINSIKNQTFDLFDILELDYSNDIKSNKITSSFSQQIIYFKKYFKNHINAMNYLLNTAFNKLDYDIIFNINIDDIYNIHRFEYQLKKILHDNYSVVASNYHIFNYNNIKSINIIPNIDVENEQVYLKIKLQQNKLIIPLSSFCFTKKSWNIIQKIDYLPTLESILICKKLFKSNCKLHICNESLLHYRIHDNQISKKYRNIIKFN